MLYANSCDIYRHFGLTCIVSLGFGSGERVSIASSALRVSSSLAPFIICVGWAGHSDQLFRNCEAIFFTKMQDSIVTLAEEGATKNHICDMTCACIELLVCTDGPQEHVGETPSGLDRESG